MFFSGSSFVSVLLSCLSEYLAGLASPYITFPSCRTCFCYIRTFLRWISIVRPSSGHLLPLRSYFSAHLSATIFFLFKRKNAREPKKERFPIYIICPFRLCAVHTCTNRQLFSSLLSSTRYLESAHTIMLLCGTPR